MGYHWSRLNRSAPRWLGLGSLQRAIARPVRWLLLLLWLGGLLLWPNSAWAQDRGGSDADGSLLGDRRFRQQLCIEYLASLELPSQSFDGTAVGGLSGLTYEPKSGQFYALSDDHGSGQARIYELDLPITSLGATTQLGPATLKRVIRLKDSAGQPYGGSFDPEGIALTPQGSIFVSTEGDPGQGLPPGLFEFDRTSGDLIRELPIPEKFTPVFQTQSSSGETAAAQTQAIQTQAIQTQGVQSNQGFESLTISATGTAPGEPLRLFTVTEGPLIQDKTASSLNAAPRDRLLHYYLGEGRPLLVAEHLYPLDPLPGSAFHGLSEILALDGEGHFLALERALTPLGFAAKLFQFTLAGASDISSRPSLQGRLQGVQAIQKQLLLNLSDLGIVLDNLEGMSWGPRLKDGGRSLLLISDDNFKSFQKTQILLFKVAVK